MQLLADVIQQMYTAAGCDTAAGAERGATSSRRSLLVIMQRSAMLLTAVGKCSVAMGC
jgi:hypothetical protein